MASACPAASPPPPSPSASSSTTTTFGTASSRRWRRSMSTTSLRLGRAAQPSAAGSRPQRFRRRSRPPSAMPTSGAAGVMFTLDTESGFDQVVFINASHGLGETVVQGAVNPDEFYLYKPNLVAGRPALLSKTLGTKAHKMIYADGGRAAQSVKTVDVAQEDQRRFSISDAEAAEL